MANNRMWLVCPDCHAEILLAKSDGERWYVPTLSPPKDAPLDERLDEFLAEHSTCSGMMERSFGFYDESGTAQILDPC